LSQILPSVFAGLGLSSARDYLGCGASPSGREILFLIDGLGADAIATYQDQIPVLAAAVNKGVVATSFPTTTATSLATLTTGAMPGAHGMLGYTVRVPRSGGRVLNSLKWDERVDPQIWQPIPTIFEQAAAAGITTSHVAAKRYEGSGFTRAVFRGAQYKGANIVSDLVAETARALAQSPSFVYLYVNDLDSAGHSDGVGSENVPEGTRIWITADHGMINVQEKIIMGRDNSLLVDVATIAGEPRMRHLYLTTESENAAQELISRWESELGNKVSLFTRQRAIATGLFGELVSPDAADRIGDVIAIARDNLVLLDPERADKEGEMIGHHGGDSLIESSVPLLLAQR
jgi:Type I phosphodiesterase / nucleotide pyrophosphatase